MCELDRMVTLPKCKCIMNTHPILFPPSSQKRIYDMDLVHGTLAASFRPRSFGPGISSPFSDSPFNLFPVQTILQMHLEIVDTCFRTWCIQFSWTIEAFYPRIVHEFRIWR